MWSKGKIPNNIIEQDYLTLDYFNEQFNDKATANEWDNLYGNIYKTGDLADFRVTQPIWITKIINHFNLKNSTTAFYKMTPGCILPYHNDKYLKYVKYFNISNPQNITRVIIFLEKWQPGHIFEINGVPIYNYKKGTYVQWQYDTEHLAANLGKTNRYTLQLTGTLS